MSYIGKKVKKIDSEALLSGKPVYTNDLAPKNCLIVKLLHSPHAYAKILDIKTDIAMKVPGIECVLTHKDVPHHRYTNAGQTFPEPSPYDRVILDDTVRYVGDPVAIIAGENEECVNRAMKLIKVTYDVLEPVLDFRKSIDNETVIHTEDDYHLNFDIGNDVKRNICASGCEIHGDFDENMANAPVKFTKKYFMPAQAQSMMEPFVTYTYLDYTGRMNIITSTQVPFHVRRIVARSLGISASKLRVIKPRIGGGFGAKQTVVSEFYPAVVTHITKKPAKIVYDRHETFNCSNSRHAMEIEVTIGGDSEGNIHAMHVHTLSNTGAYGEHGCTTVGLSGHKTLPLYNKAYSAKFSYDVVYSNLMPAAAFRGYGATQGVFAVESAVNEYCDIIGIDPLEFRLKNIPRVDEKMPMYYNENLNSSTLDICLQKGAKDIGWSQESKRKVLDNGKIQGLGMAMCMQGSGISNIDTASIEIRLNDDGFYTLMVGSTDMGTGSDTILSQMAAEVLMVDISKIMVHGVDTDISPFDPGSYASSTTYVTGMAVKKASENMLDKILSEGAKYFGTTKDYLEFDGSIISFGDKTLDLSTLAQNSVVGTANTQLVATASHGSAVSPPPFMTGFAKVEVCPKTGKVDVVDYISYVDCGTVINESLARIQAEGGIVQGIGLALYEDVVYDYKGKMVTDSFMQYKLPTRMDIGKIHVNFAESNEPTGPFGAKSIGEVVINTPAPAIAHAIANAVGVRANILPITPEKVFMGMKNEQK
ncbi:MAG: molybdopterin cofactor-binding domain-containing protein [Clostridia bacterium]